MGEKNAAPRTHIDLTDFVTNAVWHGLATGIQRVQLNIATELLASDVATPFSMFDGRWRDLSEDVRRTGDDMKLVVEGARRAHSRTVWVREVARKHWLVERAHAAWRRAGRLLSTTRSLESARVHLRPGDTLIAAGAFWQAPMMIEVYEDAAKRGVQVLGVFHDLFPLEAGDGGGRHGSHLLRLLDLSSALLTVSEFSKRDLSRLIDKGVARRPPNEPIVVPLAHEFVDAPRNARLALSPRLRAELDEKPYVLMVGSHEPRKNHRAAIDVWQKLYEKYGDEMPRLVFAGKAEPKVAAEAATMRPPVTWIRAPSDDDLARLYSQCLFTVFPSLAEGWGLPVGESFWFGKACACSTAASLPEVGGSLAVYFDPNDREAFVSAVEQLLDCEKRADAERHIRASTLRLWRDVYSDFCTVIGRYTSGELAMPQEIMASSTMRSNR